MIRSVSPQFFSFVLLDWQAAKYVLPEYSNKFSRKDFTQHQLLALAALKQRIDEDYRDTVDSIGSDMITAIGLTKVPHFTTLQKFIKRIKSTVLDALIAIVAILILGEKIHGAKVAIDASGYPSSHASNFPCNDGTDCIPLLKKAIKILGKIRDVWRRVQFP